MIDHGFKACRLAVAGMLLFCFACVRNSDLQERGTDHLQGIWVQDTVPDQQKMLHYTLHEFRFICDSIYVTFHTNASVNTMSDSCFGDGSWREYAKGVYVVRGDSLLVEGLFTRENGKQKLSGCYRQGPYLPRFKIAAHGADSVVLESRYDQRPIVLRKKQELRCVPKRRWEY